jgi:hypothetical protein
MTYFNHEISIKKQYHVERTPDVNSQLLVTGSIENSECIKKIQYEKAASKSSPSLPKEEGTNEEERFLRMGWNCGFKTVNRFLVILCISHRFVFVYWAMILRRKYTVMQYMGRSKEASYFRSRACRWGEAFPTLQDRSQ